MHQRLGVRLAIFFHLFLVYVTWGTTYLGLALSLRVLGPFFTCGFRMLFGGILLCLFCKFFGKWKRTTSADWGFAAVYGVFLVVAASGFLTFGQQFVSSGVASIVTGSTPISMLLANWLFAGGERPNRLQLLGLLGGTLGLVLLSLEQYSLEHAGTNAVWGVAWILSASLGWVAGSLLLRRYPRKNPLPELEDCALLLIVGGLECLLIGVCLGETSQTHWECLTPAVGLAFAWMAVGGASIAYSSYFWLLRHVALPVAVSYEYVVPVIALFLGWSLLDEELNARMLFAAALAVGSVFLLLAHKHNR